MKLKKLKIIYRSISELTPYANNARTHSQEQIDKIKASILEFGMNRTIGISGETIVYGHGTIEALRQLDESEAPTVDLSHLSEAQIKAYILADNRLALDAGWDIELLKIELSELDDLDFDLELTGFDEDELKLYLGDIDEEDFPNLPGGEKEPFQQKTFTLHDEQAAIIEDALLKAKTYPEYDEGLNENSNGNALTFICQQWLENVS